MCIEWARSMPLRLQDVAAWALFAYFVHLCKVTVVKFCTMLPSSVSVVARTAFIQTFDSSVRDVLRGHAEDLAFHCAYSHGAGRRPSNLRLHGCRMWKPWRTDCTGVATTSGVRSLGTLRKRLVESRHVTLQRSCAKATLRAQAFFSLSVRR